MTHRRTHTVRKKEKKNQSCSASLQSGPNINSDLLNSRVNFLCLHWCTHFLRGLSDASGRTPFSILSRPRGKKRANQANSSHMLATRFSSCSPLTVGYLCKPPECVPASNHFLIGSWYVDRSVYNSGPDRNISRTTGNMKCDTNIYGLLTCQTISSTHCCALTAWL